MKNLSTKVNELDLVSLFIRFQRPAEVKVVFKLMTGRMKGQAFITFHGTPRLPFSKIIRQGWGQVQFIKYSDTSSTVIPVQEEIDCCLSDNA